MKKMNNLFVKGRRAAVIALLAALPFAKVNADNEQNIVPEKQEMSQTVNTEQNNSEKKRGSSFPPVLIALCAADAVYLLWMFLDSRRHPDKWKGLERGFCPSDKRSKVR